MTLERFKAILEAYGGDDKRWPAAERDAARTFAASSSEAQRLLADARMLDRLLDGAASSPTSRALEDRILASFPKGEAAGRSNWSRQWIPAGAIAASLMLGLATGAALPGLAGLQTLEHSDPALLAFSDLENDLWDDLGEGI